MRLLAAIKEIRPLELIVSLPHQLSGVIPITEISPALSQKLESAMETDSDTEDDVSVTRAC